MAIFNKAESSPKQKSRNALILNAITPNLAEHPKYIELDDQFCAVEYINDFKSENDVGWLDTFLNERNMPVCIRCEPASGADIKEIVDLNTRQTNDGLMSARRTASQINDLEREQRHGLEILDIMGDANEKFFMTSISGVLRSNDPETLTNDLAYLRSAIEGDGMRIKSINWNHLTGLLASSPLRCPDKDGMDQTVRLFPAGTIAHSLFTKESGLDDGYGLNLGIDDQDGIVRIALLDRKADGSRHNSNVVIVGGSGSGKSTLTKLMVLLEAIYYGSKIIIMDPEGEFGDLVRSLGGEVVSVGGASSAKISPLQPRALAADSKDAAGSLENESADVDDDSEVGNELVLRSTIPFAKNFLSIAFDIDDKHLPILEAALEHAYRKYGITTETTFGEYYAKKLSYPIMKDVYDSCFDLAAGYLNGQYAQQFNDVAVCLRTAAVGINAEIWNTRSSFEIDSDIISFDLLAMEDDDRMRAAWYYNILTFTWSEIRKTPADGRPVRVVIDEAHNCINPRFPQCADDVKSIVKRIRKRGRGSGTTIITQEVNDFLNPAIKLQGSAILNNATYKFIGQAEAENLQELAKLYGMPHELVNRIRKASKGNFACFAGTTDRVWLKVIIEDWMFKMFGTGGGL